MRQVTCIGCQMGDHDSHDTTKHTIEGVLGGHACPCRGECTDDLLGAAAAGKAAAQEALAEALLTREERLERMTMRAFGFPVAPLTKGDA